MANKNLQAAKAAKNDEFYTRLEDINEELQHYREHFADKIVYLNCDDGEWSNFWRFFYANFGFFKLKRLIATSYHKDGGSYKYEYEGGYDQSDYVANNYMEGVVKTMLNGDGDFRSYECIEILKQADIVVTNPPFSLFREYIAQLMEYEKKFIVLGNNNAITYKEIFPLIKDNRLWFGFKSSSGGMWFYAPKEYEDRVRAGEQKATWKDIDGKFIVNCPGIWFTNLEHSKRNHPEEYYTQYSEELYPKYDNYNAIEVSRICNIPCDWTGIMGVPITYIEKYCPKQFEIIDCTHTTNPELLSNNHELNYYRNFKRGKVVTSADPSMPLITNNINGGTECVRKEDGAIIYQLYHRLFIRWKPEAMPTINDGVILYESRN